MSRLAKDYETGFTQVPNYIIEDDERLSWKAKGIYLYLVSRPDDWTYYVGDFTKRSKDGRVAVQSAIKELETYGYLKRDPEHNSKGQFIGLNYLLRAKPDDYKLRQSQKRAGIKPDRRIISP